jgi:diadenylate cyclase
VTIITAWLREIGIAGFIDISIMALLIYSILVWMKRTKRAAGILIGILIVAVVYLIARQFNLFLTAAVLQGFFAIILVALVVIFQEELRYFFERVAHWSLESRDLLVRRRGLSRSQQHVEMLVRTLSDLARDRIGALIVLRGKDLLVRHIEGGELLRGLASEKIIKSIFDTHSQGHDGAVVIEGDRIDSFACWLPLSKNYKKLSHMGTRHAAALGLTEYSDALCLVVSEERGTISIARFGDIQQVEDEAKLAGIIHSFYSEIHANHEMKSWSNLLKKNSKEKVMAATLALSLWFVLVHESKIIYQTYTIPVDHGELPDNLVLTDLEPSTVAVTLSGQRKTFYFSDPKEIKLELKSWMFKNGINTISISNSDVSFPENLVLEKMEPNRVTVTVKQKPVRENDPNRQRKP